MKHAAVVAILTMTASSPLLACGDPGDSLARYTDAHMSRDAETVYNLTSEEHRGSKTQFIAQYIDSFKTSEKHVEFFRSHFTRQIEVESETDDVAVMTIDTEYPNTFKVGLDLALVEGVPHIPDPSGWDYVVDHMESEGFEMKSGSQRFHMVCEEGDWRVLRPKLMD